jgi:hypothetical protein
VYLASQAQIAAVSLPSHDGLAWHDEASYSYAYLTFFMATKYAGFSSTFASISLKTIHDLLNSLLYA